MRGRSVAQGPSVGWHPEVVEAGQTVTEYASQVNVEQVHLHRQLRSLRVPTLVIHGDEDPILPLAHGEATAEAVPDAKLVVLRGIGHEMPEPIVDEFLQPILAHLHAHD